MALRMSQKSRGQWFKKLKSNDNYCGFACGFALEDIQKVLDEIKDFAKYNPEFADEMLQKIMHRVVDTRAELAAAPAPV
jgi:hypothetical protein